MTERQSLPDLVFLDVETTGLDPNKYRVISLAATRVPSALNPLDWPEDPEIKTWYFQPTPLAYDKGSPEAYAVNGFHMQHELWKGAPVMGSPGARVAWSAVHNYVQYGAIVAHNGEFDRAFCFNEMKWHGMKLGKPPWTRRALDTQSYAYAIAKQYGLEKGALTDTYNALVKHEGYPALELHRAPGDVLAAYRITRRALLKLLV